MSPYTSYLVLEEVELADRDRIIPVAPAGQSGRISGFPKNGGTKVMEAAAAQPVGAVAVRASKASREMKEAEAVQTHTGVQRVGSRMFFLKNAVWVDQDYTDQKTLDLKAGSDAVVNLMLEYPETVKFLALGDSVIFAFKGKFIKVSDEGKDQMKREEIRRMFR
jgi:hypothetical protein